MKIICEHPTCDSEIVYKHKFEDHSYANQHWYEANYCANHMVEHLEHIIITIKDPQPEESIQQE